MAQRYGPDVIERVREANDIVAVVSEHVRLQRAGHTYKGLCPFHSEKTPSFIVSPDKQLFYCFGCAAGGNVINFVMRLENLTFPEALESLARRAGVEIPAAAEESPEVRARREERERLLAVVELAARFYHQVLLKTKAGQPGMEYLKGRGVTDATIQRFHLGFAPDGWDGLVRFLAKRGASLDDAAAAGLLSSRKGGGHFDRFRNRVMFPIFDREGRPIAFGGRVLGKGDEPKYLNSPETALFHKGQNLFGLNVAKEAIRKAGHALIVEGYMDAVMAHQTGFAQAVASLGTSLTSGQARLLARFASEARIAYDADTAGQAATWRGLEILTEAGFRVRVVRLPAGADPDSYIRAAGPDAFTAAIASAQALNEFKIENTLARFDLKSAEGRVAAAAAIVPLLAGIPGLVERAEYQKQAALKLGVPIEALEAEVNSAEKRQRSLERNIFPNANNNRADVELAVGGESRDRLAVPAMERELVRMLLAHTEFLESFQNAVGLTTITDAALREIAAAMIEARQEGVDVSPATLSTRLGGEEVAQRLSELALQRDDHLSRIEPGDLLRQFARHSLARIAQDLARGIESASTTGDLAALNRLVLEYKSLRDRDRQAFPTL